MTDLFTNAAQNADRDTSATAGIIDRALAAGYSIRVQDAHGTNLTREQRNADAIREAIGASPETTLHIIDMRSTPVRYIVRVTVSHGGDADTIRKTEPCAGREDEAEAITTEPTPILDEIADYSDQLAEAAAKRPTARQMASTGHFPDWIDATEARIINKLITAILKAGYQARIYDGEEIACHWTSSRKTLQQHTAQTDETTLHLRAGPEGRTLGTITLIHGNHEDVISDASAADEHGLALIDQLCTEANR